MKMALPTNAYGRSLRVNMTGTFWGRLTVIGYHSTIKKRAFWQCLCECGNTCIVSGKQLRKGATRSCGCFQIDQAKKANTTHGQTKTRLHRIWLAMKNRVGNPNNSRYRFYGGKGIKVCQDWLTFKGFQSWALRNGYQPNLTIERLEISKNYCPENCTWITMAAQQRNKGNSVLYKGETAADASRRLGGTTKLVSARVTSYGWSLEDAFTRPVR